MKKLRVKPAVVFLALVACVAADEPPGPSKERPVSHVLEAFMDGDYARAETLTRQHIEESRESGKRMEEATWFQWLGHACAHQYKNVEAEKAYLYSIRVARGRDEELFFSSLYALAMVYHKMGLFQEPKRILQQCDSFHRSKDSRVLNALGNLHSGWGKFVEAEKYFAAAQDLEENDGSPSCTILLARGRNYSRMGHFKKAKGCFDKAGELWGELANGKPSLFVEFCLGELYVAWGKHDFAEPLLMKFIKVRKTSEPVVSSECLEGLARIELGRKHYVNARGYLGECLQIRKEKLGPTHPLMVRGLRTLATVCQAEADELLSSVGKATDKEQRERAKLVDEFLTPALKPGPTPESPK